MLHSFMLRENIYLNHNIAVIKIIKGFMLFTHKTFYYISITFLFAGWKNTLIQILDPCVRNFKCFLLSPYMFYAFWTRSYFFMFLWQNLKELLFWWNSKMCFSNYSCSFDGGVGLCCICCGYNFWSIHGTKQTI